MFSALRPEFVIPAFGTRLLINTQTLGGRGTRRLRLHKHLHNLLIANYSDIPSPVGHPLFRLLSALLRVAPPFKRAQQLHSSPRNSRRARDSNPQVLSDGGFQDRCLANSAQPSIIIFCPLIHSRPFPDFKKFSRLRAAI